MPDTDARFVAEELDGLTPATPEPDRQPQPRARKRGRPKRGVCRECGEPASTSEGTYCDEHQPVKADKQPRARTPRSATTKIETELRTNLEMLAQIWQVSDPVCGAAMLNQAPQIAAFWGAQAKANPRVARVVENVAGGGGLVGGVLAHMPVLFAVYAHHVAPRRQQAAEAADVPTGVVDVGPNGVAYVHEGGGTWAPAKPDDVAAAAGNGLLTEAAQHAGFGQTGGHGDASEPAG